MLYKRNRLVRSWLRSFLSIVFSKCGRCISRKIIPFSLCFVVLGLSLAVPSYAAAETVYSITDFDIQAKTVGGSNPSDYSSTVTFVGPNTYYGYRMTWVYNTNSNFYASGQGKMESMFHLTNLSLKDEYNINFNYAINAAIAYTFDVYIVDMSNGNNMAEIYSHSSTNSPVAGNVYNCNVNFTLSDLGLTSNSNINLMFLLTVPNHQVSYDFKFGFTDITITNLDDDSGLLDSILNWLSRIYHSIAGGTDREGVNHTGIVQGITNGLTNLGNRISNFFADLKQGFLDKLEAVKNSINNAIAGIQQWFIDLKDNIINGLKSLFIPHDGYFAEKKTQLETFATEHFGALYQGPDIMIDLIRKLLTVDPSENPGITMPSIEFDFQGQHYTLTEAIHYSFSWVNDSSNPVYYFYHIYRGFVTVILFVGFGNYLIKKYRDVFEGGGDGE